MTVLCAIFIGIMTLTLTLYPKQTKKSGSLAALKIYTSVVNFFGLFMPGNDILFRSVMISCVGFDLFYFYVL